MFILCLRVCETCVCLCLGECVAVVCSLSAPDVRLRCRMLLCTCPASGESAWAHMMHSSSNVQCTVWSCVAVGVLVLSTQQCMYSG